ncbi:MAG TPA: NAD(P)H-dependent oxidoreductase [Verrucomicrobiales bacterium]|nr:NAD(P)H-dependent oxidoreductase [Verrucomicrobiales bacterium]
MSRERPRVLVFGGSLRRESWNHKLAQFAAGALRDAGAEATLIRLSDFPFPIYDGDLEEREGLPEPALRLRQQFLGHDALFIASPEYNSSVSGALKNAIDWVSRPVEGEKDLAAFRGKVAALVSASPGALGGLRGLVHLRAILGNIGVIMVPKQHCVAAAPEAFGETGELVAERDRKAVKSVAEDLVELTRGVLGG